MEDDQDLRTQKSRWHTRPGVQGLDFILILPSIYCLSSTVQRLALVNPYCVIKNHTLSIDWSGFFLKNLPVQIGWGLADLGWPHLGSAPSYRLSPDLLHKLLILPGSASPKAHPTHGQRQGYNHHTSSFQVLVSRLFAKIWPKPNINRAENEWKDICFLTMRPWPWCRWPTSQAPVLIPSSSASIWL